MRQMEAQFASGSGISTIVPFQTDYVNDPRLCLTSVSFLPEDIATTIQTQILTPLGIIEPEFYYYPIQSLHITIQNIRVINRPPHFGGTEIEKAKTLLSEIVPQFGPFKFELNGTIRMPTSFAVIALVSPQYDKFVRVLRHAFIAAGISDDKKYFTDEIVFAHATICRYTRNPSVAFINELKHHTSEFIGTMDAPEVSLVETNAGAHPSKTTVFGTYRFQNHHG